MSAGLAYHGCGSLSRSSVKQLGANKATVHGDLVTVDIVEQPKTIHSAVRPARQRAQRNSARAGVLGDPLALVGLGGFGHEPALGDATIGRFAVGGFFAISGFLVTGSRLRLPAGAFGWRRFLRVFPGLWVCLLVTAFVLAPAVGALRGHCLTRCVTWP
jgi:hypothetical protein